MKYWVKSYVAPWKVPIPTLTCSNQPDWHRRTCCLVLLCTALGGCWSLEQPSGSLLEFYPTWRFILLSICESGGPFAVMPLPRSMSSLCTRYALDMHLLKLSMHYCGSEIFSEYTRKLYYCWVRWTNSHFGTLWFYWFGAMYLRCPRWNGGWGTTAVPQQNGIMHFAIARRSVAWIGGAFITLQPKGRP